jgi:4-hydroxy-tetrahydrodipicolinate reductase
LLQVLPTLALALDGYDIEIVEAHHRHKLDAPSGTALALAEAVGGVEANHVHGRYGVAKRTAGEIGIHAIRGGGNTGEHAVLIMSEGEEIRIEHRTHSRRTFADGALRAAHFIVDQPPSLYGMADMFSPKR